MASVTSEAVAAWWPLVESNARRFQGIGNAEFDDLVQEGAFHGVWEELLAGRKPSVASVQNAMKDYIRFWSHRGLANGEPSVG